MDKQSVLAFGAAAGLGYFLGRTQTTTTASAKAPVKTATAKQSLVSESEDEVERLIRPNILALTPYRCARDDYDQGTASGALLTACI